MLDPFTIVNQPGNVHVYFVLKPDSAKYGQKNPAAPTDRPMDSRLHQAYAEVREGHGVRYAGHDSPKTQQTLEEDRTWQNRDQNQKSRGKGSCSHSRHLRQKR